jgi:hypothetical protein
MTRGDDIMRLSILATAIVLTTTAIYAQDHGCMSLAIQSLPSGDFTSTISAQAATDVNVWVLFTPGALARFSGDHEIELRLTTPHGYLYESRTLPVSSDKDKDGQEKPVVDYPFPVPYHVLQDLQIADGHFLAISADLPIAASPVTSYSLYGQWTAEAIVDDETVACSKPLTFTINP